MGAENPLRLGSIFRSIALGLNEANDNETNWMAMVIYKSQSIVNKDIPLSKPNGRTAS